MISMVFEAFPCRNGPKGRLEAGAGALVRRGVPAFRGHLEPAVGRGGAGALCPGGARGGGADPLGPAARPRGARARRLAADAAATAEAQAAAAKDGLLSGIAIGDS